MHPDLQPHDTCVLVQHDCNTGAEAKTTHKSADHNIYVYMDVPVLGSVSESALNRVRSFLKKTFWNNTAAFQCSLSGLVLALHGRNVDRAIWTVGPGGVGQSLLSHLIATTFGSLHSFLDLNIYFTEDEFRKQCEGLVGRLVVTGQESPDLKRAMREDRKERREARREKK